MEAEASEGAVVSSVSPSSLRTSDTTSRPVIDVVSAEPSTPLNDPRREGEDSGLHNEAGDTVRVEAAEDEGHGTGDGREHFTVSVHVQVAEDGGPRQVDLPPLPSSINNHVPGELGVVWVPSPDRVVTSPRRTATQFVRRPMGVQTTLTSSFVAPVQPQLPNLALEALQRLAQNSTDKDDSIEDFQPLKKRKIVPPSEEICEEAEEVSEEGV